MADNNNILLVTDYEEIAKSILEKLVLLRNSDKITICNSKSIKKALTNSLYSIVILHECDNDEYTLKLISNIKETKTDTEILLLLNNTNPDLVLSAYDLGIFDYFTKDSEQYDLLIKIINCFKIQTLKELSSRNEKFLYQQGVIDDKTKLYQYKHLKEVFLEFADNLKIQNGVFIILTLDESTKTKISINRLSTAIKASIRMDDIAAVGKAGKYYIIVPNIEIDRAKDLINKIQAKMGDDFKIRAGISKIGLKSFETLDKTANDSLISAIQNDSILVCLEENIDNQNSWLEDDDQNTKKKDFKLFKSIATNKLDNVITPIFYRHQKDFENKLTNTQVSQYANNIECVFSLKNKNIHSELTIRHNSYAKFKIEINHSGLDSAENTKMEIPLKDMTNKFLISLLKQLKDEYKKTAFAKGNKDA